MTPGCRNSIKVENCTLLVVLYEGGGRILVVNDYWYCKLAEEKPAPLFADIIYTNNGAIGKFYKLRLSEREKPPVTQSDVETSRL
jgi:hypothetical protein